MKNIVLILVFLFGMNVFPENAADGRVIYKEDGLSVAECVPLEAAAETDSVRVPVAESELYENFDIIADVTVTSFKEVSITYEFMDTECVSYKTLAEVIPNKIYCSFNSENKRMDKFTVAISNSSYAYDSSYPEISVGKRYILFAENTGKLDDSLKLSRYSDYFVSCPEGIAEINGSECTADNIFSSYSANAKAVSAADRYSMPLKDFENTLNKKIRDAKKSRANEIPPEEMSALQYNASKANNLLYESFEWGGDDYIYPDDFAGTFVDFDTLHVLVTDKSAVSKYEKLLADYSEYVTFDIVKYSYNELFALNEKCVKELQDNNFSITEYYVDVDKNKGVITVLSNEYDKAAAYAASYFDGDKIEIAGGEYVVPV